MPGYTFILNFVFSIIPMTYYDLQLTIQIKVNPAPYVNPVKLVQNARMDDTEVVELLRIANGYLPSSNHVKQIGYKTVSCQIASIRCEMRFDIISCK